jgi:uncharacterized membrane protein YraQ (UPF0718 family)/copper chaperone CopZ
MNYLQDFLQSLVFLTAEMAPFLLLGFLIAGVLKVFVPQGWLDKYLGAPNFKSVIYGALVGVPLPLCSCGVIPTGVSLKKNGASDGATISFLISTPQTGVDSIMITYSLLGWPFAVLRPLIAFITGIAGGAFANRLQGAKLNPAPLTMDSSSSIAMEKPSFQQRLWEMLRYAFFDFMMDIVKWLTIGLLLAALIDVLIPDSFIEQNLGNPWLEMLFALLVSIPLYICATGSVPLAAVLMLKGLSPGAALVLLMAGPATNVATITVIQKTMGSRNLWVYLFTIISGALLFGGFVNAVLPANYTAQFLSFSAEHHNHESFGWFKISSAILLTIFMLNALVMKLFSLSKSSKSEDLDTPYLIFVEGMTCQHCEANVAKNLGAMDGISDVVADQAKNQVGFSSTSAPDYEAIKKLVESLGYKYLGEK